MGKRPDRITRESAALPEEPVGTEDATIGTVKWWLDAKGYGAIATEKTAPWDIWFTRFLDTRFLRGDDKSFQLRWVVPRGDWPPGQDVSMRWDGQRIIVAYAGQTQVVLMQGTVRRERP